MYSTFFCKFSVFGKIYDPKNAFTWIANNYNIYNITTYSEFQMPLKKLTDRKAQKPRCNYFKGSIWNWALWDAKTGYAVQLECSEVPRTKSAAAPVARWQIKCRLSFESASAGARPLIWALCAPLSTHTTAARGDDNVWWVLCAISPRMWGGLVGRIASAYAPRM